MDKVLAAGAAHDPTGLQSSCQQVSSAVGSLLGAAFPLTADIGMASRYPTFAYDAEGGGGVGSTSGDGNLLHVEFDVNRLNIPPVTSQSAKVLGLPLPPGAPCLVMLLDEGAKHPHSFLKWACHAGLRIGITPLKLEVCLCHKYCMHTAQSLAPDTDRLPFTWQGTVNRESGEVQLQFLAEFVFTAAQAYTAPALKINTSLTTEAVQGKLHGGRGRRLDARGNARCAVARPQGLA